MTLQGINITGTFRWDIRFTLTEHLKMPCLTILLMAGDGTSRMEHIHKSSDIITSMRTMMLIIWNP